MLSGVQATISKAVIIHPDILSLAQAESTPRPLPQILGEAVRLAQSIGLAVVATETIRVETPHPATLLGRGVVESLAHKLARLNDGCDGACLVIINAALTPVQHRNLETALASKVIDRTALILEIFGARATTSSGRLQVELAALNFQRSRLVRSWTHLERQRGGGGFLGGPGERQIELDRRLLASRISRIKTQLKQVARTRHIQRRHRQRFETPTVALIGYTNAGKSSLFNALTEAGVLAADMLFATLDPNMRGMRLTRRGQGEANGEADKNRHGRQVILADTVGFISQLPTELIAAFKSTLEEVVLADALLHVHDCTSPVMEAEARDVTGVLHQLGMDEETIQTRVIHVYNKSDLLDQATRETLLAQGDGVVVSAKTGEGLDELRGRLDDYFAQSDHRLTIAIPFALGCARAWLYRHGAVLEVATDEKGDGEWLSVLLSPANLARFTRLYPNAEWHET